jgi:hypothetical protein
VGRYDHGARPLDAHRFGGEAEFERDLIRARTSEGRERAKASGVKLGRKPKLTEHQKREAMRRRDRDGEPVREIAPQLQCQPQHDFAVDGLTAMYLCLAVFIAYCAGYGRTYSRGDHQRKRNLIGNRCGRQHRHVGQLLPCQKAGAVGI